MKVIRIKKAQYIPSGSAVEGSKIAAKYPLAHMAVELVREYQEDVLYNVGRIEDMPEGGAYGYYSTGENVHQLPPDIVEKIRLTFNTDNVDLIPTYALINAIPELNEQQIQIGDTIHVNIDRILKEVSDENSIIFHFNVIKQIAETILHESTHVEDVETSGETTETSAESAETPFSQYMVNNFERIAQNIKNELGMSDEEYARCMGQGELSQ